MLQQFRIFGISVVPLERCNYKKPELVESQPAKMEVATPKRRGRPKKTPTPTPPPMPY